MNGFVTGPNGLRVPRAVALYAVAALVSAASLVSFAESYRGLWLWSHEHGLAGLWADVWPLQVDVFIAIGELALFVALADAWKPRSRYAAWTVTVLGLAVSVSGNVGHVSGGVWVRGTAAVPPLAAAASLAVGLGILKRVVEARRDSAASPISNGHRAVLPGLADLDDLVVHVDDMPDVGFIAHMQLRHPDSARSREAHEADHAARQDHIHHVHDLAAGAYR
jgi:hypothetical protein